MHSRNCSVLWGNACMAQSFGECISEWWPLWARTPKTSLQFPKQFVTTRMPKASALPKYKTLCVPGQNATCTWCCWILPCRCCCCSCCFDVRVKVKSISNFQTGEKLPRCTIYIHYFQILTSTSTHNWSVKQRNYKSRLDRHKGIIIITTTTAAAITERMNEPLSHHNIFHSWLHCSLYCFPGGSDVVPIC